MRRTLALGLVAVALAALTGCGNDGDDTVRRAAQRFYTSIARQDAATACAALTWRTRSELEKSEQKPCVQAVLQVPLPRDLGAPLQVRHFGVMSQVRTVADTAFLTRQGSGWYVVAAGCKPAGATYDCELQGG